MPALLSANGRAFELSIMGYQYPSRAQHEVESRETGDWDANWLNIRIHVDDGGRNWHGVEAALTTWEVHALVEWFRTDALLLPSSSFDSFTEPCFQHLATTRAGDRIRLDVTFSHGFNPPDADSLEPVTVSFDVDDGTIRDFALGLEKQLERFPER